MGYRPYSVLLVESCRNQFCDIDCRNERVEMIEEEEEFK